MTDLIDVDGLLSKLVSHGAASGVLTSVNGHEPKNQPGDGLPAAVWLQELGPVPTGSGLAVTTARVEFAFRIYSNMVAEPQDEIDPEIGRATSLIMGRLSEDFTLDGTVRKVDLLGSAGAPLRARAGYLNISGGMYRVMTIFIPLLVDDAWTQAP